MLLAVSMNTAVVQTQPFRHSDVHSAGLSSLAPTQPHKVLHGASFSGITSQIGGPFRAPKLVIATTHFIPISDQFPPFGRLDLSGPETCLLWPSDHCTHVLHPAWACIRPIRTAYSQTPGIHQRAFYRDKTAQNTYLPQLRIIAGLSTRYQALLKDDC